MLVRAIKPCSVDGHYRDKDAVFEYDGRAYPWLVPAEEVVEASVDTQEEIVVAGRRGRKPKSLQDFSEPSAEAPDLNVLG